MFKNTGKFLLWTHFQFKYRSKLFFYWSNTTADHNFIFMLKTENTFSSQCTLACTGLLGIAGVFSFHWKDNSPYWKSHITKCKLHLISKKHNRGFIVCFCNKSPKTSQSELCFIKVLLTELKPTFMIQKQMNIQAPVTHS